MAWKPFSSNLPLPENILDRFRERLKKAKIHSHCVFLLFSSIQQTKPRKKWEKWIIFFFSGGKGKCDAKMEADTSCKFKWNLVKTQPEVKT